MATVFVQDAGDVVEWTAAADITADDFVDVGGKLGIALNSALSGELCSVKVTGVARLAKDGGTYAAGAVLNADVAGNQIASGGALTGVGIATQAAAGGDATVLVRLNG